MSHTAVIQSIVLLLIVVLLIIWARRRKLPTNLTVNQLEFLRGAYLGHAKLDHLTANFQSTINDLKRMRLIFLTYDDNGDSEYAPTSRGYRYLTRHGDI